MAGVGGYQQPAHAAPVSGPGALSQRTDGPQGGSAPVDIPPMQAQQPQPLDTSSIIPMDAPTQRPDEPVTAGSDLGAGPGSNALPTPSPAQQGMDDSTKSRLKTWMPYLMWAASQPDSSPETRQFVRQARGDFL